MAEIDRLTVVFDARFDKLEEKLNKAVRATYAASSKMEKTFDQANDNISRKLGRGFGTAIGDSIGKFARQAGFATTALEGFGAAGIIAAAGVAAVGAAFAGAIQASKFADDIADTANRLTITTKALQEYRFAVHALGGEYEDADRALEGFAVKFGAAHAQFTKRGVEPFEALGLDATKFKTTEEALTAVTDKISKLSSTAEQAAIADKLGLTPMLPALRAGTAAIDKARQAAERLGFVMDDAIVQKGADAHDRLEDLSQVLRVVANSALIDLTPAIISLASGFADVARAVAEVGRWLDALNNWAPSKALMNIMEGANKAGASLGAAIGTDQFAKTGFGQSINRFLGAPQAPDPRRPVPVAPPPRTGALIPPKDAAGRGRKGAAGPRDDTDQRTEAVNAAVAAAARDMLQAQLGLTENIEARSRIERDIAAQELAQAIARLEKQKADIDDDKGISEATKRTLKAKLDEAEASVRLAAAAKDDAAIREAALAREDRQIEVYKATIEAQITTLEAEANIATTAAAREKLEKRILDLRQQLERDLAGTQIDRRVRSGELSPDQGQALKDAGARTDAADQGRFAADHLTPMQEYIRSISDADTAMQNFAVHGVQQVTDALADAITGATSFKAAFSRVISSLLAEITRINLNGLVSGNAPSGGAFLSSLGSLFSGGKGLSSYLQGAAAANPFLFANGTDSAPGGMSIVGERGPELLNLPRGAQVIPNDILRGLSRGGGSNSTTHSQTLHMHVYPTPGMTMAEARRTGNQIGAAAQRRMAQARKAGF